jgi:hypothetical protein
MSSQATLAERPIDLGTVPERIIELTQDEVYALPLEEQHRLQLAGLQKRFADLIERIPVLTRLAEEQGIAAIDSIEALAPLLIPHSAMKSYPMSFLEQSRFDRLTQWLDGFTTHDLSAVPTNDCDLIDDRLVALDTHSDVRVLHSTGTSGKLSFLPRGTTEMHLMVTGYIRQFETFREEPSYLGTSPGEAPVLFTQYCQGGMAQHRLLDFLRDDLFGGDESMVLATNPSRFSADAASIGGRLRVAESRGELGKIQIIPS